MTILEKKTNKTREAMQMCILWAERIQAIQKRLEMEIDDDHDNHIRQEFSIYDEIM